MLKSGSIPKKVSYVYNFSEEVRYGAGNLNELFILTYDKVKVYPTYVVDSDYKKSIQSAIKWAQKNSTEKIIIDNIDNDPIDNIKILSLDIRMNGGRAYKVLINDKYYVDLRENTLLDLIFEVGISFGGKLNGQYVWAHESNQLKLIRYNSNVYKQINNLEKLKNMKIIKIKDLEKHAIYSNKQGKVSIFLGNVEYYLIDDKKIYNSYLFFNPTKMYYDSNYNVQNELDEIGLTNISLENKSEYVIKLGNVENKNYLATIRELSKNVIKKLIAERNFYGNDYCNDYYLKFTNIHYPDEKIKEFDYRKYMILS